jgi:hypothetical protein
MHKRILLVALAGLSCAQAAPPTIFETLDPVRPDETLLLFGADVTPQATAEGLRLADDPISAPPAKLATAPAGKPAKLEMLQATDLSAKVLIPKSWKPGVYAVRVRNADGPGAWQFANRPQLWWQMSGVGGKANPGGELRVFGKNFGPQSRLWLVDHAGKPRELKVTVARDYDVTATLPADLPIGSYRIWLHNGHGGAAGFGEPLALEVAKADAWPTTVYNVRDYGAKGDNQNDDTYAIRRALAWAGKQGGGVVYLPRGTYIVTGKLVVPERVTVRGEGRDKVFLKVPIYRPAEPQLLPVFDSVLAGNGKFAVENLTIVARATRRLIAAPDVPDAYGGPWANWQSTAPDAPDVRLRNLRLQHLYFAQRLGAKDPRRLEDRGPSTIVVKGPDFVLEDSVVISSGMPIQIQNPTRARICRNVLRTGRNGWYGFFNFVDGLFEQNDIAAADLEGNYGGVEGSTLHVMFRANHWHDAYGDGREALSFDQPYMEAWMGHVESNGATLNLGPQLAGKWPPEPTYPRQLLAVIAGGRGLGQAVPVVSVAEKVVILARPFAIQPDETSLLVISGRRDQVIVAGNTFEDASVAVQLYAQSREFLIAENQCARTGGSYAHAGDYIEPSTKQRRYSYALFNQWLGNTFEQGFAFEQGPWRYSYVGYTSCRTIGLKESTPAIGNRIEGNRLLGGTRLGATVPKRPTFPLDSLPVGQDGVFERNVVRSQPVGLMVDPGQANTLVRANHFEQVAEPVANAGTRTLILP